MINNKENDNSTIIMLTIFFSIFLMCVIFIFVFERFDDNYFENIVDSDSNIIINLEDKNIENIKNRLEEAPFLDLIISKKNLHELNNNELLYYLIKLTELQSQFGKIDNVPSNIINDIHKDSLFNNINFNHDNIVINNKLLWVYNKEDSIYVKNNIIKDNFITLIVIKLDKVTKNNNIYIFSYKYGFKNIYDNKIYGNYNDCVNKVNFIYEDKTNNTEVLNQELNKNYNNIKDKLNTYNYTVELKNKSYILKDFYID